MALLSCEIPRGRSHCRAESGLAGSARRGSGRMGKWLGGGSRNSFSEMLRGGSSPAGDFICVRRQLRNESGGILVGRFATPLLIGASERRLKCFAGDLFGGYFGSRLSFAQSGGALSWFARRGRTNLGSQVGGGCIQNGRLDRAQIDSRNPRLGGLSRARRVTAF